MRTALKLALFGGQQLWTPLAHIAELGIVAWWDASFGVTSSGGVVGAWLDRVGSNSASQATGSLKPSYSLTSLNGYPGISTDGADDYLGIVGVPAAFPIGGNFGWMLGVAGQNFLAVEETDGSELISYGSSTVNTGRELYRKPSGGVNRCGADNNSTAIVETTIDVSGIHVLFGQYGGGAISGAVDGVSFGPVSRTVSTGLTVVRLGRWVSTSPTYWKGPIGHVLVGAGTLSLSNRQKLEAWLLWSCAMQSQLPSDHPYKNRRP